jgi:F-type H+-transporting ATPase subunit b
MSLRMGAKMARSSLLTAVYSVAAGCLVTLPALAADPEHGSGGLPQFDPSSFTSQVFWLVLVFAFLYLYFSRKSLPTISGVIENRREQVEGDRATAERLRNEAESVLETYESGLSTARSEAQRLNMDAVADGKAQTEQALKKLQEKAEAKIADMEKNLSSAKSQAMDDMTTIAAEVASAAAEKIVGITADLNQAKSVVQSLNKMSKAA